MLEDFLKRRFVALQQGDFATVYSTYHSEAPFLQNFKCVSDYVDFARQQLSHIKINSWQCLQQRELSSHSQECILVMELEVDGVIQPFYELALLLLTDSVWLYHSAQKLSTEEYKGSPEDLNFTHFDLVTEKIRF